MSEFTFRSVREMGGVTDSVVVQYLSVMRAHEKEVRPDLDDLTEDQVRADLRSPHTLLDFSGIWFDAESPVMVSIVEHDDSARNISIDGYAMPVLPPVSFLPMFERGLDFARRRATADLDARGVDDLGGVDVYQPDSRLWQIQMFCREEDARYREFLESVGLKHVRNFYRMLVDLDETHDALEPYEDLELIPALTEPMQRQLKDLARETFREHWGSTDVERTFEEWKALRESAPGFDWSRAWIVQIDNNAAGLLINNDMLKHEDTEYIWTLGVLPEYRGRGVATWLLRKSFHDARRNGLAKAALNVDAENSTGAVGLYEAVGMRPTEVYCAYRAPLSVNKPLM